VPAVAGCCGCCGAGKTDAGNRIDPAVPAARERCGTDGNALQSVMAEIETGKPKGREIPKNGLYISMLFGTGRRT